MGAGGLAGVVAVRPGLHLHLQPARQQHRWGAAARPAPALPCPMPHPPRPPTLCPTQGGCEDEHQRMDYMARDKFLAAHNEDQ